MTNSCANGAGADRKACRRQVKFEEFKQFEDYSNCSNFSNCAFISLLIKAPILPIPEILDSSICYRQRYH